MIPDTIFEHNRHDKSKAKTLESTIRNIKKALSVNVLVVLATIALEAPCCLSLNAHFLAAYGLWLHFP